jgi:nucleoside 2-deoxyribosyltransferase
MRVDAFGPVRTCCGFLLVIAVTSQFGGSKHSSVLASSPGGRGAAQSSKARPETKASGGAATITVYVASPLGFADSTRAFMDKTLIPAIQKTGIHTINPWDPDPECDKKLDNAHNEKNLDKRRVAWARAVECFGAKNEASIKKADGIVAVLDGVDVDSGTAAEIGYGTALGKWVIGYRGDFRRTGEDESAEVNLQVEYFIRRHGGQIVHPSEDPKDKDADPLRELKAALAKQIDKKKE